MRKYKTSDKERGRAKRYYENNKEYCIKRQRRYYDVNREIARERTHRYYRKNRNKILEQGKRDRAANKEKYRASKIKYSYGLSKEKFDLIRESQNDLCPICSDPLRRPHVDHCHETGRVRALLCNRCNVAIGMLREDMSIILRAADYVAKHRDISDLVG
jgi:hypothetical protein